MGNTMSQRQSLASKLDALSETELQEVLDYVSMIESMRRSMGATTGNEEELLTTLADAHENRRARQAFEWESVRRKAERRAAVRASSHF
ncbi:MAG TPA: hypothetical protein VFH91_04125 [Pyrinomonadaceae bacterium]|jgi:hypothetical protein|nr:hypothetical protein [Pyrinomonadaceae bacterium]